jgi:hypothetical protein
MNPMTPQQQMIFESFQSETYVQNRMDVQHEPLWDTITFNAAATITTTNSAFYTSVGPASGKTLAQTNMRTANELAAPQAFSILGMRFRYAENILRSDLLGIVNGFAISFVLGDKPYNQGPPWFYNAGGGIHGFSSITDEATYNNGSPSREAMHKLAIPIVIENKMNFSAALIGNNLTLAAGAVGGTGALLQLLLDGLHARGVQ